ncbi:MAG: DUF1080 domain-containing protein [Phycisphaeraceae bacterium]|nr:DUF1080 domain-containing protein [Phycisphaeraceae bacterium]
MLNRLLLVLLVLPTLAACSTSGGSDCPGSKSTASGFVPLFNGKDLAGWKTEGNWVAEDGLLEIRPVKGKHGWKRYQDYLYTEKQYGNYVLSLEYRLPPKGNSGLHFRIADPGDDWSKIDPVAQGIECQILDSLGKPDDKMSHHDHGGIIRTQPASKNMSKPAGEWNKMVLTCDGQTIKVVLNGEGIINIQQDQGAMKDRPLKGYIALQDHGQQLWFRNIKIKELD